MELGCMGERRGDRSSSFQLGISSFGLQIFNQGFILGLGAFAKCYIA